MEKLLLDEEMLGQVSGGSKLPYRVQPGDTLAAVAKKYNVTVEQLMKWNNLRDPNILMVGQELVVKF
jgi:N-acetylmuramoyl-L-alanine amidase